MSKSERRPISGYVWDTWNKPPQERKFLAKLDSCLLIYAALSYFSKYLDQQNVTNAYVSGMQEDLGLHGNQLNYITTAWTCGYVIGQIPANMLITRVRPSIWIPLTEVVWSVLTMTIASAKSFGALVTIRFFVGLAESSFYPAMQYVTGSWYKPDELGKRACIFHCASAFGPMVSGLFIIDGIITVPIALLGFLIMPDLPSNTRPNYLYSQDEIDLANRRMEEVGRKPPSKFTRKKSFNTSEKTVYTIAQINTYPLPIYAVQIVTTLTWAWWSDALRARWPPMVVAGLWNMAVCIALAATPVYSHITQRWVLYYMTPVTIGLSGLILSWANELTGHDSEKRAFVVASCNTFAYVVQTWFPIVLFPQVEQPRVFKGNIATAVVNFAMICTAFTVLALSRRDAHRKAQGVQTDSAASDHASSDEKAEKRV
ncbi:MFS general substrate transporter [Daedalea quercina L-15889]|uniref:MFS general substrate transporter n=1 Tax=Daedalea quercina L-15889 TaxID=1314783 RepID=A0A165P8X1_9APHY|nr:MFS general substrate transporter [Daedalea quercina L-15889]